MPFGSFEVKGGLWGKKCREVQKEEKKQEKQQEKPTPVPGWNGAVSTEIQILLVGSSQMLMRDYLCSLKQNMDAALGGGELSYYTKDHRTIQGTVAVKKQIEECFWDAKEERLLHDPPEEEGAPEYYTFSISPAGKPDICVELRFCCMTPGGSGIAGEYDAAWVLAEGMDSRTLAAKAEPDEYEKAVKGLLDALAGSGKTEVFFLISQFEYLGHFRGEGGAAELDASLRRELYRGCRQVYGEMTGRGMQKASMCQMQIYGGLEHFRKNDRGEWIQRLSQDGYFQSYVPVGCHLPVFHTIKAVKEKGGGFFGTVLGEQIWMELQKNFSGYLANSKWRFAGISEEDTE